MSAERLTAEVADTRRRAEQLDVEGFKPKSPRLPGEE